jgi:putative aldouronate transport system permease protein
LDNLPAMRLGKQEGKRVSKTKKSTVAAPAGKKRSFLQNVVRYRVLLLMCLPAIIFFFAFNYMPLPGIYVAFVRYNMRKGIFGSPFVGLENFEFLIQSGQLVELTKNTILYNLAFILLGNILAVFVAILLNEMQCKWFKKVSQTMMFLPYFISQVLVGILVFNMLNYDTGFVNNILSTLGLQKWEPYADPNVWPVILVIVYLWQQTGYNSVVYFASIMGIDAEIIEAARVDGANGFQKIRYIILPSLRPTIVILLLFALGGIVKGNFGLFYNIVGTNPLLYGTTDIIETFVYRATMTDFNFSTASAVGLYQSIIGFVIVMVVNYIVKKIEPDYSLF